MLIGAMRFSLSGRSGYFELQDKFDCRGGNMSVASMQTAAGQRAASSVRCGQLLSVIVCIVLIANLQYGWTLFVNPMKAAHPEWSFDLFSWHLDALAAIQLAFTIFIALETWLTPIEG